MSSDATKLNRMNESAKRASLGDKMDQIITLLNSVKTILNTHITGGVHRVAATVNVAQPIVTAASVDTLATYP